MGVISYLRIISQHLISEKCLYDVLVGQKRSYVRTHELCLFRRIIIAFKQYYLLQISGLLALDVVTFCN
jgi:hypothetical protein